jgi:hypothetical protein
MSTTSTSTLALHAAHLAILSIPLAGAGAVFWTPAKERLCARRTSRAKPVAPGGRVPRAPSAAATFAAIGLLGAAVVHAMVAPAHFRESDLYGAFFVVACTGQVGAATLLLARPSRSLLRVVAVSTLLVIVLWAWSRSGPLPVGPDRAGPELTGPFDAAATMCELVTLWAGLVGGWGGQPLRRMRAVWSLPAGTTLLLVVAGVAVLRVVAVPS